MLPDAETWTDLLTRFHWRIPERFNIGVDVSDKHPRDNPALIHLTGHGEGPEVWTFGDVSDASNRLANALLAAGLQREDRIGILLPQRPETGIAHVAAYKAGMIAVPLFTLFGPEALEFRLSNSGAAAVVTDEEGLAKLSTFRASLPNLRVIIVVDRLTDAADAVSWVGLLERSSTQFTAVDTAADDPALIIYTSGTTGPPKGALHAHRVLLGHLPGVEMPQELFPKPGDRFWTPADWAWIGGLLDVLLPSWHHGVPVVFHRVAKFDPEAALRLMADNEIRNVFLPPTAMKLMRQATPSGHPEGLALRSVGSGGETLGGELLDWGREVLGVTVNEFYGQTECNLVVSNCSTLFDPTPGSMGRAVPGHTVAIVDEAGDPIPDGTLGRIGIRRPDPVMFLGYWQNEQATRAKFAGEYLVTGDMGRRDDDGQLWYVGRDDDVITSAGYRIGPGEVEDCLLRHPAVALAAVVGTPDPIRTELVTAVVVPAEGVVADDTLARDIQAFVKTRLAAHEYPRRVIFQDSLPMTTTGKIMRKDLRAALADASPN